MAFRDTFDCLWCGTRHTVRSPDDVEGWAQLCPDCVGRAGDNEFLRFRLRSALADRAASRATPPPDEDDWFLRRGPYAHGPVHDAAWNAELDAAGRWLDALPLRGRIVELAAGTGWWSPLLAGRGELTMYDADGALLDRARDRLVAHGLRAHLHVRADAAEPEAEPADVLFVGARPGGLPAEELDEFVARARRWMRPGGLLVVMQPLPDPAALPAATPPAAGSGPDATDLRAALEAAGFGDVAVTTTGRFFILARGRA